MEKDVSIIVFHTDGCPSTPKTVERIRECTSELGIPTDIHEILVRTQEEADAWRFLGSPTVQVNGIDIDPGARTSNDFGFMLRTYGASAMPSKEMIGNSLREAMRCAG